MTGETITIIGGGPSGMTLAWWLVEQGIPVTLLEREPEVPHDMRASTFHPATLDLLAPSGLSHELLARGTEVSRWQYLIHATGETAIFDMACLADVTEFPFRLQCEQFQLTELLAKRLSQHPLCDIRFSVEFVDCHQDASGVDVSVIDQGREASIRCDWLLAADGAKSGVRKALGQTFEGQVFSKTSITLVIDHDFPSDIPGLLGVNYVWLPNTHYSLMQLRDSWRFTYSPAQDQRVEDALTDEVARSHVAQVSSAAAAAPITAKNYYTLHQRCLERFRVGRVIFLGDSAHLNSPAGGMGMNSGIHDAYCLAEHLVAVWQGADASLLDRYDRRRRTIARDEVQRLSAKNYARHRETREAERAKIWTELQAITADPVRQRDYLLDSSMIRSRQIEQTID